MVTFDFEYTWFSSKGYCELEAKTVSNFPDFLSSPIATSQVLFSKIIRQFSQPRYDSEGRETLILMIQYLRNASIRLKLRICIFDT